MLRHEVVQLVEPLCATGRSRVQFPVSLLDFFNLANFSSRTTALGSTQPLTEMSTRKLSGGKGRPARGRLTTSPPSEPIF
jgi:hypothetical protein